jgi:hypothetical protein
MRESVKVVAVLIFCVSATVAAVVWFDDRPTQTTWVCRIVCSLLAVAAVGVFLRVHYWSKPDLVPDFLGRECRSFFERSGLCFSILPTCEDGVCIVTAMFQNRYDHRCTARIALRPVVGVFRSAKKLFQNDFSTIVFDISCGAGSFGIAGIPLAVPRSRQDKELILRIGATVDYPEGKGKKLRFRDGIPIRHSAEFRSTYFRVLKLLFLFCGGFFSFFPPR